MKKLSTQSITLFLVLFLFSFLSHAQIGTTTVSDTSLYRRLGGESRIGYLISEAMANMAQDRRINMRLARADVYKMEKDWDSIICNKTGGACSLPLISKKIKITEPEWNAGIEDIIKSLDKFKIREAEKTELINVITALRKDYFNE